MRPPRAKAFHTYGTVGKMRFEADGEHPFTGIFETGAVGFVRASLAVGMPNYSPAAAFKFLIDGPHPSQNLLVHQSLDKQASRDFFERAPTNHTLTPGVFPNTAHVAAPEVLALAISSPIELQRLDHLAVTTNDGTAIEHPCAPELVYLYGTDEVRNDPASAADFREILAEIPAETPLYRMYGKASAKDREGVHRLDHARVAFRGLGVRGSRPGLPARLARDRSMSCGRGGDGRNPSEPHGSHPPDGAHRVPRRGQDDAAEPHPRRRSRAPHRGPGERLRLHQHRRRPRRRSRWRWGHHQPRQRLRLLQRTG